MKGKDDCGDLLYYTWAEYGWKYGLWWHRGFVTPYVTAATLYTFSVALGYMGVVPFSHKSRLSNNHYRSINLHAPPDLDIFLPRNGTGTVAISFDISIYRQRGAIEYLCPVDISAARLSWCVTFPWIILTTPMVWDRLPNYKCSLYKRDKKRIARKVPSKSAQL